MAATDREKQMIAALLNAEATFVQYAKHHLNKGTVESYEKAIANAHLAVLMRQALGPYSISST